MQIPPNSLGFAARELERAAGKLNRKQQMWVQYAIVGCMALMALPAAFQTLGIVCKGVHGFQGLGHDYDDLTHRQQLNYQRLSRRLNDMGEPLPGHSL